MSPLPLPGLSNLSLLAILLLLPVLAWITKTRMSSKSKLPPCPPRLPLLGNLHQIGSLPHRSLHALSKKHGPLMLLKLGQIPTLVVSSSDAAREIMRTNDHVFASRPSLMIANILVNGGTDVVFSPYNEHWRQTRKLCVNHLLSTKMVQSFRAMREKEVASMVAKICDLSASSEVVNVSEVLILFTKSVLFKAISGKYFGEEGRTNDVCRLIEENIAILGRFCVSDFLPSLAWLDVFIGLEARARRAAKRWDDVLDEIVDDHARRSKELDDGDGPDEKSDFVNVLLALQRDDNADFSLNRAIIRAILQDMIAAGIETSFVVLDWVMAELIRNSEAMKKLQDEVRGIATAESTIRERDLSRTSYLKAVIKEVLRLHPPVSLLVPRESMDRCTVCGYEIPRKTRVLVNAWSIGRDPGVWKDPEEFRPERFLGSPIDFKGHDFEFIPFGAGRRICPGMQFAVSTLEVALANLVCWFDWKLPEGMKSQDLDMADSPGLTTRRRQSLHLVPKPLLEQKCIKII